MLHGCEMGIVICRSKTTTTTWRQQASKIKMKIYDGAHENINKFHSRYSLLATWLQKEINRPKRGSGSPGTSTDTHTHPDVISRSETRFFISTFNAHSHFSWVCLHSSIGSEIWVRVEAADWCTFHIPHNTLLQIIHKAQHNTTQPRMADVDVHRTHASESAETEYIHIHA